MHRRKGQGLLIETLTNPRPPDALCYAPRLPSRILYLDDVKRINTEYTYGTLMPEYRAYVGFMMIPR